MWFYYLYIKKDIIYGYLYNTGTQSFGKRDLLVSRREFLKQRDT